ncbi:MAG TPA: hypothetical protein VFY29_14690 [Terriglobia bacterium]|nr:hypothetical protein [Terriglobia bacterium]
MKKKNARAAARREPSQKSRPEGRSARSKGRLTPPAEWITAIVLTGLIIGFHVVFLTHAGGLWRDEVQIFNISTAPTFASQWQLNEHDTFPLLWQFTLRAWKLLGLTGSDFGIRFLGFLVGLAILGMLWYTSAQFGAGPPLAALVLFGMSPVAIIYGDSVRGYGFGIVWLLFMTARLWKMFREPTAWNVGWAALAVLLAVQSFYFSVVFFAAIWMVATGMLLYRRDWRTASALTGIGVLAAVSMTPYFDVLRRQLKWHDFLHDNVSVSFFLSILAQATDTAGKWFHWIWAALLILTVGFMALRALRSESNRDRERMTFVVGMAVAGTILFFAFLLWRHQATQIWYYLAIMALWAVVMDIGLSRLVGKNGPGRLARLGLVGLIAALTIGPAWRSTRARMTNADGVARQLEEKAGRDDLILVTPWWPGVTFARYYQGQTPWTTMPDLGSLTVQRFDLFREKLFDPQPIQPVLDRVAKTLQGGHRVWIVGGLQFPKPGEQPGTAPPPPVGPLAQEPYLTVWSRQAGYFIQSHVTKAEVVQLPDAGPVSGYENLGVIMVEGWRETAG